LISAIGTSKRFSRRLLKISYIIGVTNKVIKAPEHNPPTIVIQTGCIDSAPSPGKNAIGTIPATVVKVDIKIGRKRFLPASRQAFLTKVFLSTSRIDIKTTRKKNNLEFAQAEEAVRMVYKKGFSSIDDVKSYLSYINQADKELNIIKKQANTSIYKYLEYSDKMEELMSYIPKLYEYYINGNNKDAYIRAKELYSQLSSNGVSPVKLYKSKKEAEELIGYIDKFKKKLFVDKIVCNRIISSNTIEYVMQIQKKRNEK